MKPTDHGGYYIIKILFLYYLAIIWFSLSILCLHQVTPPINYSIWVWTEFIYALLHYRNYEDSCMIVVKAGLVENTINVVTWSNVIINRSDGWVIPATIKG